MAESTEPIRVLFYADMEAVIPHCVAAAEMLRRELGAHVIMTVLDRKIYFDEAFENYELYDHENLFQWSGKLAPIAASEDASANEPVILRESTFPVGRRALFETIHCAIGKIPSLALQYYRRYRHIRAVGLTAQIVQACRRAFYVKRFLRKIRPDIIILAEDNIERLSKTLVNEGRKRGIPSIIIPFTIPNPLEPAKAYRDHKLNQVRSPLDRLVISVYPKWQFRIDGRSLIRMPAVTALVLEALGQSSPAPWILNRGNASRIMLDSEAQRDGYLELGFPAGQLSVVGDVNGEVLHRGLSNRRRLLAELLAKHELPQGRPLILCGFPPNQYGGQAEGFEFQSYDQLIEGWMGSFKALSDRANVLVRPHPRLSLSHFESFKIPNVRFTLQPTAELIPLSDLYVASISATIRWAIACGIPVINYDTYRYRYGDYDKVAGVILTESLMDFRAQLARFLEDPLFAANLAERQRREMWRWGMVDDKLPERFSALVTELIGQRVR